MNTADKAWKEFAKALNKSDATWKDIEFHVCMKRKEQQDAEKLERQAAMHRQAMCLSLAKC